jgi:hypothetical protein
MQIHLKTSSDQQEFITDSFFAGIDWRTFCTETHKLMRTGAARKILKYSRRKFKLKSKHQ